MNILIFSWRDPKHPLAGGAEQMVHEHAKGWVAAGHKVTLFASRFPKSKGKETLDGILIVRRGHQYIGVQFAAFYYYMRFKKETDLVVDQFHGLSFLTPLYVRKPKIALIHETARGIWFLNILSWPLNLIFGAIGYVIEPFIFLFYKNQIFITVSNSTKKELIRFGIPKKNIKVIFSGVILGNPPKIYSKHNSFTIIFLGVLSRDKGIEDALECFSILNLADSFNFWIVGKRQSGAFWKEIQKKVKKLNLNVKFFGFVTERKKYELLSKAHLLINPSFREGWGLVNIEANSVYTPVIAYNTVGLIDSVKHNYSGIICEKNTPSELAKEILKLLKDEKKYLKMQKSSYLWSKNFTWEKARKKSLNLIKKIANES